MSVEARWSSSRGEGLLGRASLPQCIAPVVCTVRIDLSHDMLGKSPQVLASRQITSWELPAQLVQLAYLQACPLVCPQASEDLTACRGGICAGAS